MGLEKATRNAHEVARNTLNSTQKKMKRDYDVKNLKNSTRKAISYMFWIQQVLRESVRNLVRRRKDPELCWTD